MWRPIDLAQDFDDEDEDEELVLLTCLAAVRAVPNAPPPHARSKTASPPPMS